MDNSSRVMVNTAAQYGRTVINLCLSLVSARLILGALGVSDYGIYTLIAGIISLLSFVINALVVTTQRFLSFYSGKGDQGKVREMFANSLFIHILMALLFGTVFELLGNTLFDGFFNISPDRIDAAETVYHIVTVNVMLSFVTAPFRALLIAHENIVFISAVDVLDAVMRLVIAILITHCESDRLVVYALFLCGISLMNFLVYAFYDLRKYDECVIPRRSMINAETIREMGGFAGWTIYSIFCITGRTQGVAVIINKFFSVAVNAAYGVGMQVNAAIAFLSQSVVNAINPQIMKAEGAGDRRRMIRLSEIESKLCFMLLSMFLIPCIFEMPALLNIWLGKVPEYSVYFCRGLLLASVVDQLTIGLGAANQAIGKIRAYSLTVNTIKFLTIPVIIICLLLTHNIYIVMSAYVLFELICAVVRLFFLKKTAGLSIREFTVNVFMKEALPLMFLVAYCASVVLLLEFKGRFVLTLLTSPFIYAAAIYFFGLCPDEKEVLNGLKVKVWNRIWLWYRQFMGRHYPKRLASALFRRTFGRRLDWKNPKDLNEKINWLKFHSDTSMWSKLADKYAVRSYVAHKGYEDTLVKLYGAWESPEQIDADVLPDKFIVKLNNGSGDAVICKDKTSFDPDGLRRSMAGALKSEFGYISAEPHYLDIKPMIIAEELLDASRQSVESDSLIDYKIWCFNGVPECVFVALNRTKSSLDVLLYDTEWNVHPEYLNFTGHYRRYEGEIPRPANLDRMLKMAADLSAGFPQVRVDLYEVDGKVYFGELTFTSCCGLMDYFDQDYLRVMGDKVVLP